ncbi:S9 family peptidase [bacterium]|nr:S9 family peptidase [candidate division CSSED10-310 bacterium]
MQLHELSKCVIGFLLLIWIIGCAGNPPHPIDLSLGQTIPVQPESSPGLSIPDCATRQPPIQPWRDGGIDLPDPCGAVYPMTNRLPVTDSLHGVSVTDDYRWLENGNDPDVKEWTNIQVEYTRRCLDALPQRDWLSARFRDQFFYDDSTPPSEVYRGTRTFWWEKKKNQEHWTYHTRANDTADAVLLIDPNSWTNKETLDVVEPSWDGRYLVFGKARGGDENPVLQIMDVETGDILSDTCAGWRQGGISWLPDNSGFYYTAHPLKGAVPEGEEHYWHSAWLHHLGTTAEQDIKVYSDDMIKEAYHQVLVSDEGTSLFYYRLYQGKSDISYKRIDDEGRPVPLISGADGFTTIQEIEGRLFFWTNIDAPMGRVWVTDVNHPQRENWQVFLPETDDYLKGIALTAGKVYAVYLHDVHTVIRVYNLDGEWLKDLPLPELCSASVFGYWHKPKAKVGVTSFNRPGTTYEYDFDTDELSIYHKPPIAVDSEAYIVEQVFYPSKDGTRIPMFLISKGNLPQTFNTPTLLYGYGGFGAAMTPIFSTGLLNWMDAGGAVACAGIRGGGEYGKEWHEAGKKEKKQTVFDDFIAAAEWLTGSGITCPNCLVIKGESNGGLLVGAVAMQRPDLFKAVYCGVPLLDMIRYHKFGIANLWESEYGSSEDPEAFNYLMAYSPYHQIRHDVKYPSMLIQAGVNDARVDPMHARKMIAGLQNSSPNTPGRALLLIWEESGHGGGTDLTTQVSQQVDVWAFLMDQVGMIPADH